MRSIMRTVIGTLAAAALLFAAAPIAEAGSGNYTFPNTCNIYWQNSWGGGQGSAYTYENANCSDLKVQMYADPSGGGQNWQWFTVGYLAQSQVYVAIYVDQKPGTSRHYGKNTSGGTGYYIERAF